MIEKFLEWLISPEGGALLIVGWFVAWGLEDFTWWKNLTSKVKSLIILAAAVAIGLFATWALANPQLFVPFEPYFKSAYLIIITWLATQVAHKADAKKVVPPAE